MIKIKKLSDEPSKIFSGVWRIFKSSDGLIVTTTKPGTILCLNDDLNYTTCDNWEEIFRKYTVYDVVNDMFFVDGGDKILYVDRSGKILSSTPDIFWDKPPTLFPVACWRRIINADTVYVMETKKTGITITKITQK